MLMKNKSKLTLQTKHKKYFIHSHRMYTLLKYTEKSVEQVTCQIIKQALTNLSLKYAFQPHQNKNRNLLMCKFNNTLLDNHRAKDQIKKEMIKYFERNKSTSNVKEQTFQRGTKIPTIKTTTPRVQLSEGHLLDALTVLGPTSSSEKGKLRNLQEPERKITKSVVC